MKRLFCLMIFLVFLLSASAACAIRAPLAEDPDYAEHLKTHIGMENAKCTGNYVKIRTKAKGNTVKGHLEMLDSFTILEVKKGFVKIRVDKSHKSSPDSKKGMTGWVDARLIDCGCDYDAYYSAKSSEYAAGDWRRAYYEYIVQHDLIYEDLGFTQTEIALIQIDDDYIPELHVGYPESIYDG